ncbi:MAG: hypothetical protein PUD63_00890 [Clostridia bacterium]|nr:hypothetical protein [Clostridia bacterium]
MTNEERTLRDEAYGRLRIWRDGCREIHDRAREARSILLLQDPRQDAQTASRRKDKRTLQLQTLKSTFNNCVADQMDNMPEALMLPERAGLEDVAEDLTDVVRYVLAQNDFEALHRRRVEDCFATGTAVTQVAWDGDMDGGRGNIALIRWPIEAFLWDPASENLQDSRAVFKVSWHPMSWFQQHYPDRVAEIGSDESEYSGLGMAGAQEQIRPADEDRAMLIEYWYRLYDARQRRYTINVAYLAGGALLSNTLNVYRHGLYPFVLDVYTPIEGLPVGDGLVQELAPMMRYVNRYASYIDMNLRMASKGRLLIDRNAGIDKEALMDWENDVVEGDRIDPSALQWLQTQPFTGMATRQMMQLQADIKQDSGQNQFARGETVGGVTAASAISALQEAGGKITRLRTQGLNQGFRELVTQVMWLISQFYDRRRVFFITGRQGEKRREINASPERLFGKDSSAGFFPAPPYTVQVQVQRRNPLRQQAQNELVLQAYEMSAQAGQYFPLSTLFELLQVEGKERILPVLRQNESLPAENAELREMCREADGMMNRQRHNVQQQQALVEQLLAERAELEETILLMQKKLDEQNMINEAEKQSVTPA